MKVKATNKDVYGSVRRKIGDVFDLAREEHLDTTWMERVAVPVEVPVDESKPAPRTGGRRASGPEQGPAPQSAPVDGDM